MVPENWHICINKGITYLLTKKKHRQSVGLWAGLRGVNTGNRNCKLGEENESVLMKHVPFVINQT